MREKVVHMIWVVSAKFMDFAFALRHHHRAWEWFLVGMTHRLDAIALWLMTDEMKNRKWPGGY